MNHSKNIYAVIMTDLVHAKNNFDFLRVFAASLVIISHSFPILGLVEPNYSNLITLGSLGVYIFFIINGFLITQSWDINNNPITFLWKRVLRIFPGLIFAAFVVTFILGIMVTTLSILDYLKEIQTYRFLFLAMFFPYWNIIPLDILPGVFKENPMPFVNGPLWTLVYEWCMYLLILGLGIMGVIKKKLFPALILLTIFIIYFYEMYVVQIHFFDSQLNIFLPLFLLFFISSRLYFHNRIKKFSATLFFLSLIIIVLGSFTNYFLIFLIITLPYIVLFIAHYPIPKLNKFGTIGDFSYGLYIFAWPVQQTILVFFNDIQIGVHILCSFLLTIPIAYISWHFVESKALSHKNDVYDIDSLKIKVFKLRERIKNHF